MQVEEIGLLYTKTLLCKNTSSWCQVNMYSSCDPVEQNSYLDWVKKGHSRPAD
jgi:hypothetical protein